MAFPALICYLLSNQSVARGMNGSQAAKVQDVNKLFNSDTVTQRTIYRDCMGSLPLC